MNKKLYVVSKVYGNGCCRHEDEQMLTTETKVFDSYEKAKACMEETIKEDKQKGDGLEVHKIYNRNYPFGVPDLIEGEKYYWNRLYHVEIQEVELNPMVEKYEMLPF